MLDNVANGIVTIGEDGVIESFNRAAIELFGYDEHEAIGAAVLEIVSPKVRDDPAAPVPAPSPAMVLRDTGGRSVEAVGHRKNGSTFPIELELSDVQLETRKVHIGCLRDIFERQTYTEALRYQALHDDLTNLPNRVLFGDRVNNAIRAALRAKEPLALLVMDLDGFKQVNDTFGHQSRRSSAQAGRRAAGRLPARRRHGGAARRRRVRDPADRRHRPRRRGRRRLDDSEGLRAPVPPRRSQRRRQGRASA